MSKFLRLGLITCCLVAASGCSTVKVFQRGHLAQDRMAFDPDPMDTSLGDHIYFAKEGSSSGSAVTGGGCGCN